MTVGTTAVKIEGAAGAIVCVQNLGPGAVYLGGPDVAVAGPGIKIDVGQAYEPPRPFTTSKYVVADAAGTDVRLLGA